MSKQIEREIGHIMLTDKVLMDVTQVKSPNGDRRGALCSCSGVHVTNDLQVVKVYMSVLSDDASVKERILSRLSGLSGWVSPCGTNYEFRLLEIGDVDCINGWNNCLRVLIIHQQDHALCLCRYVRRRIGERVRLRLTPEIRFVHDEAVERGERVLSLLKKIESGDAYSGTAQTVQDGAIVESTFGSRAGFWVDTPGGGKSTQAENPKNPFLEGVGDSDYDSDDESAEATFFSADMFPDANPVLDEIAARERQSEWEGQRTQPRYRVKGGRSVRK